MSEHDSSIKEVWRNALAPGSSEEDFPSVLFQELAEFVGVPLQEVESAGQDSQQLLNAEWETGCYDNPTDFYRKNKTYLYNLVHWHANYGAATARIKVMNYLQSKGLTNVLDFGSGVGSTAVLLASNSFKVGVADVAEYLLSFVRFRMEKRGLRCSYYDLNKNTLPNEHVDAVTAIDVLEHVSVPKDVISKIYDTLRLNGLFCFNVCGKEGAPMHVSEAEQVLCHMRLIGFNRIKQNEVPLFVYQKVPVSGMSKIKGFPTYIYYIVRLRLRHILELLGVYKTMKRIIRGVCSK